MAPFPPPPLFQVWLRPCTKYHCLPIHKRIFYFISFIGHRNSRLQVERPMGLVQTGKRDPWKAQPLNKSMTR